jgi:hypothetical protein
MEELSLLKDVVDLMFWVVLMTLGQMSHFIKQVIEARKAGNIITLTDYWRKNPYSSLMSITGGIVLFLISWESGTLNTMMAFSCGYIGNSAADMFGTRAAHLAGATDVPDTDK